MEEQILNKKIIVGISLLTLFSLFYFFLFKSTEAQVCLPLTGYIVWPGTWEAGRIPMASTSQYTLAPSPLFVSGSNVGLGTTNPVYNFQVNGDISGTRLCIGSDCRSVWPGGGIAGSGSSGQVTFWTGSTSVGGDNNLFWDNTNKRLGIGTTAPQTSLHVVGNVTANSFLGTINAANVSSGQFGANTGGGNYSFPGNVGIGTTAPGQKLTIAGGNISFDTGGLIDAQTAIGAGANDLGITAPDYVWIKGGYATILGGTNVGPSPAVWISQSTGNVGIGTTAPNAKLSITTTGTELLGSAASSVLRIMAGALGTTAGNTLKLASIGFTSSNNSSLGIEALRTANGTDWTTTAIGLKMDVDNTSPVNNAQIWLTSSGNVGIGTTAPSQGKLVVYGNAAILGASTIDFYNAVNDAYTQIGSGAQASGLSNFWIRSSDGTKYGYFFDPSSGNVGIGTINPAYRLDVSGTANTARLKSSEATTYLYLENSNGKANSISLDAYGNIYVGGAGENRTIYIRGSGGGWGTIATFQGSTGNVGIGATNPQARLSLGSDLANVKLALYDDGTNLYGMGIQSNEFRFNVWSSSADFRFYNSPSGNALFTIKGTGNVGIGTTTPTQKLTVAGNIDVTGNRIVNLAAPINSNDAATKAYVDAQVSGKRYRIQVFTSNGTWTRPSNVDVVWVTMCGGGGGGGGGSTSGGGGGGGGHCFIRYPVDVSSVSNVAVTVGAGGAGVYYPTCVAGNGGDSKFGSFLIAVGGYGGVSGGDACASYGSGTGGKGRVIGGDGGNAGYNGKDSALGGPGGSAGIGRYGFIEYGGGGGGGGYPNGSGGNGGYDYNVDYRRTDGGDGIGYGSGGGGGGGGACCFRGGNGAPGIVIVEWFE